MYPILIEEQLLSRWKVIGIGDDVTLIKHQMNTFDVLFTETVLGDSPQSKQTCSYTWWPC